MWFMHAYSAYFRTVSVLALLLAWNTTDLMLPGRPSGIRGAWFQEGSYGCIT